MTSPGQQAKEARARKLLDLGLMLEVVMLRAKVSVVFAVQPGHKVVQAMVSSANPPL